jgi:hypothetical protein
VLSHASAPGACYANFQLFFTSSCNDLSFRIETGKASDAVRKEAFRPYQYLRHLGRAGTTIRGILATRFIFGTTFSGFGIPTFFEFPAISVFPGILKNWDGLLFSGRITKLRDYLVF